MKLAHSAVSLQAAGANSTTLQATKMQSSQHAQPS